MTSSREHISAEVGGATIRATLDLPHRPSASRVSAVVLDRGPASGEAEGDTMEVLASAIAQAGMLSVRLESRAGGLILEDFDRYSPTDAIEDLLALVTMVRQRSDVDGTSIGLLGWHLGAIAVVDVASRSAVVGRVCLVNPVFADLLDSAPGKDGQFQLNGEFVPRAYVVPEARGNTASTPSDRVVRTLVLQAAANRADRSSLHGHSARSARALGGDMLERVLIARADHRFVDTALRKALIERIVRFFAARIALSTPLAAGAAGARA